MKSATNKGFTLVELMVVMGVIMIIMALAAPAVISLVKGNNITQATQTIADKLALARQTAIGKNHDVEVRFLKYVDAREPGSSNAFRALQILEVISANRMVPVEPKIDLPPLVVINNSPELSSLVDPTKRLERGGSDKLGKLGTDYNYVAMRFRPDGSTDLDSTKGPWFFTLHEDRGGQATTSTPPSNFATIEVDPVNGTLKFYRPGV